MVARLCLYCERKKGPKDAVAISITHTPTGSPVNAYPAGDIDTCLERKSRRGSRDGRGQDEAGGSLHVIAGFLSVSTEMSLCGLAYSLKRTISMLGVGPLIASVRA